MDGFEGLLELKKRFFLASIIPFQLGNSTNHLFTRLGFFFPTAAFVIYLSLYFYLFCCFLSKTTSLFLNPSCSPAKISYAYLLL